MAAISSGTLAALAVAAACVALFAGELATEPGVQRSDGLASKKWDAGGDAPDGPSSASTPLPLLGTLVQTHTDERLVLDGVSPAEPRFDALLADRALGASIPLDPRLLGLLRTLAVRFGADGGAGAPSIEIVSGFRSPKLNEMMRKKGHHVASHSQHSLGHAVDFRIVVPCEGARAAAPECDGGIAVALDPRVVVREIRATGWDGGTGIYTLKEDWFVHADVGPNRTWFEGPAGPETPGMTRPPR